MSVIYARTSHKSISCYCYDDIVFIIILFRGIVPTKRVTVVNTVNVIVIVVVCYIYGFQVIMIFCCQYWYHYFSCFIYYLYCNVVESHLLMSSRGLTPLQRLLI